MELPLTKLSGPPQVINGVNGVTRSRRTADLSDTDGIAGIANGGRSGGKPSLEKSRTIALEQGRRHGLCPDDAEDTAARWIIELLHQAEHSVGEQPKPPKFEAPSDEAYWRFASNRFVSRDAAQMGIRARQEMCFTSGQSGAANPVSVDEQGQSYDVNSTGHDTGDTTWHAAACSTFWGEVFLALSKLPLASRQAFVWRHIDQESIPVIAARLEKTEEVTRQLLRRVRLSLRPPLLEWAKSIFTIFFLFAVTKSTVIYPLNTRDGNFHTRPKVIQVRMVSAGGYHARRSARK